MNNQGGYNGNDINQTTMGNFNWNFYVTHIYWYEYEYEWLQIYICKIIKLFPVIFINFSFIYLLYFKELIIY